MIELLFNFTSPQYFSQDWLLVYLMWLYKNNKELFTIDSKDKSQENKIKFQDDKIIKFLEEFDRELAKVRLSDTKIIDYINNKVSDKNVSINVNKNLENILNKGTSTPHYWFYKLDYLLWRDYNWKQNFCCKFDNLDYSKIKEKFRLTRLNSIEHIFPHSKKDEFKNCDIDCFGNLALVSNHLNSSLIDENFEIKRTIIEKQIKKGTIESLKMLLVYSKYKEWNCKNCENHQEEMIDILKKDIKF